MTGHVQILEGLGVPPRKASVSRFPLQVLGWITSLWAFRCNRSRKRLFSTQTLDTKRMILHYRRSPVGFFVNTCELR